LHEAVTLLVAQFFSEFPLRFDLGDIKFQKLGELLVNRGSGVFEKQASRFIAVEEDVCEDDAETFKELFLRYKPMGCFLGLDGHIEHSRPESGKQGRSDTTIKTGK
jgi:hypothetical protein